MVHRRLLTVMLLLLVGLLVASAVSPPPERRGAATAPAGTSTAATGTSTVPLPRAQGPDRDAVPPSARGVLPRDRTVSARPGQTLDLRVTAEEASTIAIPALGALQPASPGSPAQFIVAFDRPGRYVVRNVESGDDVGAVVVE